MTVLQNDNKIIEQGKELLSDIQNLIDNHAHNDRHNWYIAVNVKRYDDYFDLEQLIENKVNNYIKMTGNYFDDLQLEHRRNELKEYLLDVFSDEHINNLWFPWLEWERECLIDDLEHFVSVDNPQYWNDKLSMLEFCKAAGIPVKFEYLQGKHTIDEKIEHCKKCLASNNTRYEHYTNVLSISDYGFIGRSGGWFTICDIKELEHLREEIEDNLYLLEDDKDYEAMLQLNINEIKPVIDSIYWLIDDIEKRNKAMSFKEEIDFRIDEEIELKTG